MNVAFPMFEATGNRNSAVVYFELEPGQELGTHTDSAEEVLFIVQGTVEAKVGGETGRASAGDLVLIPEMAPHGVTNVGADTAKCLGFFTAARVTSTFADEIMPVGQKSGGTPALPPQNPPVTWAQVMQAIMAGAPSGSGGQQ